MQPETVRDEAQLLQVTGQDPYVRYDVAPMVRRTAYRWGRAVALRLEPNLSTRPVRTCVLGPDDRDAAELTAWALREQPWGPLPAVLVERHRIAGLGEHTRLGSGGNWDWMWTEQMPPRHPAEADLIELDDRRDLAELLRLNEIGNPSAESEPGTGKTRLWLGARDGGRLIAAAALHRSRTDHPILTGIVVDPEYRGRGLGRAMTAALTRVAVQADGVATLGMYADNANARALYESLGYRVAHRFSSRMVLKPEDA